MLKGITDPHLYFTCKSENEKRLSIVSCKFKSNSLSNYLHTNTSSNAIVNAASNISYRTLLEASDTRSMLQADVFAVLYMNEVKNLTNGIGKLDTNCFHDCYILFYKL